MKKALLQFICKFTGHTWEVQEPLYLDANNGMYLLYKARCNRCDEVKHDLLSFFKETGKVIFSKNFGRSTIPD